MIDAPSPDLPIRDAATIVLVRRRGDVPEVLMGQRGQSAAFMPDKFVFPGGAVDPDDLALDHGQQLDPLCAARLKQQSDAPPVPLAHAAIRELWEETGLMLGTPGKVAQAKGEWADFAAKGDAPDLGALRFFFRAVTPPGRSRRFDARFFWAEAEAVASDLDDFSRACDELRHLQWIALPKTRDYPLPFITTLVLDELDEVLAAPARSRKVPFLTHGAWGGAAVMLG